ncbi:hypothetical protein AB0L40_08405 [Patulibacter sp. NPDC049589]|uniref:hypothetical protein n=1 Tax=Patulibacter sp. NPDC049589 TaxID=3154731 RepID=UPI00343C3105
MQVVSVSAVCALGAFGGATATAAPITASGSGHATVSKIPTGGKIKSARSSIDPATGVWTTTVTFDAAQSATVASALRVSLSPDGSGRSFGWVADTDPDRINLPQTNPDYFSTAYTGTPGAPTSITFNAERTAVTLTATDPGFVGYKPDVVRISTGERDGGFEYSSATFFLGPVAPKTTIPAKAKHLTAAKGGTIRIPLNALKTKADRRITLKLHGRQLGLKSLPAKYSSRREAVIRLSKTGIERLGRGNRTVVLQVETRLDNGSHAYARKTVKLRRR